MDFGGWKQDSMSYPYSVSASAFSSAAVLLLLLLLLRLLLLLPTDLTFRSAYIEKGQYGWIK